MGNGAEFRGVITDWGGVLTTPLLASVRAWIEADEIDWDGYRAVMREWVWQAYGPNGRQSPIRALERGECSGAEFERILAAYPWAPARPATRCGDCRARRCAGG